MIKIIKKGTRQTVECEKCGCLFSFDANDINYGNQRDPEKTINCPQCMNKIDLWEYKNENIK